MDNINPELFRQIAQLSEDVYFIYDTTRHTLIYLSPAFEKVWGQPADRILNNPTSILDTIHADDTAYVKSSYQKSKKSMQAGKFEFRILCPDQTRKFIRLKVYPIQQNNETSFVAGIAEDFSVITKNIFYAEKINARKNSTLEILAHDLKGPIGMISMMASAIQRDVRVAGIESLQQPVQTILNLCKRNIALIRNLVNQEFLESAGVDLRKERADLVWGISDVIQNYKNSADIISKNFILNSSAERIYIQMDSLKLMQVFNNLISNSIKFTPNNGNIAIDIRELETSVQIVVSDNGIGIPEEMQPYLFDKFTRARRTGLRGEEPVGLGMSIIKTIVELHGGKISFKSKENEGSTFYIEIPKV